MIVRVSRSSHLSGAGFLRSGEISSGDQLRCHFARRRARLRRQTRGASVSPESFRGRVNVGLEWRSDSAGRNRSTWPAPTLPTARCIQVYKNKLVFGKRYCSTILANYLIFFGRMAGSVLTRMFHSHLINSRLQPGEPRREAHPAASAACLPREKPLKRLSLSSPQITGLKPGVNERRRIKREISRLKPALAKGQQSG